MIYIHREVYFEKETTQTFEGFCHCSPHHGNFLNPPPTTTHLAIVQEEDILEHYWLENDGEAVEELKRLYCLTWGCELPIRVFELGVN